MKMKKYLVLTLVAQLFIVGAVSAQDYTSILKNKLLSSRSSDGMTRQDVEGLTIYNQSTNRKSGVEHVYAIQKHDGIEVFNANVAVAFRDENIIHIGDNLQLDIASRVRTKTAVLTPIQAATSAASLLGAGEANFTLLETISSKEVILTNGGVSLNKVPVKLVYQLTGDDEFRLAWDLNIHMLSEQHWYSVRVDAVNGEILNKNDWVNDCVFGNHSQKQTYIPKSNAESSFGFKEDVANTALNGAQYNVFALPLESPNHGSNQLVVNPSDPEASPFGWHDTNGVVGPEWTITRGNNVLAQEDINSNNGFGASPDGGDDLIFDFEYLFETAPVNMVDAVTTNLFYTTNVIHDVMYHYGFDEQSGNFQSINYTGQGEGGDRLLADAQDGATLNNASFQTPPEGSSPRMSMFLWDNIELIRETLRINGGTLEGAYGGVEALFGAPIPETIPLTGNLVVVEDDPSGTSNTADACDPILNGSQINGNIVLIRRGICEFSFKALAAQNEGAIAVVMVNNNQNTPLPPAPGSLGDQVTIPVIMTNLADGDAIITAIEGGEVIEASIVQPEDFVLLDGSLDNGVVTHEYGHGISKRLTSGASNTNCLNNSEAMDEGTSDYYGYMFTMREGDISTDAKGHATYANGQDITGPGNRVRRYTTDFEVNNLTYGNTNDNNILVPHGIGTVWATMLWDMTWYLIDEYGFDPDLYNGIGGNNISLQLVTDGLKLQPCEPGFVDARDAIFAAIDINTQIPEEDKEEVICSIWNVFATRGLGVNADQGSPLDRRDQIEDFNIPNETNSSLACVAPLTTDEFLLSNFSMFPNPSNGQVNLSMKTNLGDGQINIIDLNGRIVFSQERLLEGVLSININGLSKGVYLLEVSKGTVSETKKLIIN